MIERDLVLKKLKTTYASFNDVWFYSPNSDRDNWNGRYEKCGIYMRPMFRNAFFDLKLLSVNPLGLTPLSVGIYVIKDESSVIYVGLTKENIVQRFDAHVSKLTAVNKWHHPKRWRKYAEDRLINKPNYFENLNEFEIGFFDFADFQELLVGDSIKDQVEDMEALVYFGLCETNPKERFLNTEASVGTRAKREKWKLFY